MEVPVLIRRTDRGTFQATVAVPEALSSEAATRDEALSELTELLRGHLSGVEVVALHIPTPKEANPWLEAAGSWADHPDIAEVERHIREYRQQVDEDPLQP